MIRSAKSSVLQSVLLLSAVSLASLPALADATGLSIAPEALAKTSRDKLTVDIQAAKQQHSAVFAQVRDVQGVKPEVYKKRQNPLPEASRELRAFGAPALLPMLDALAFRASQPELTDVEREALRIGMLSAVGELRDARSAPVLAAVLTAESASEGARIAAADALGKRCEQAELAALLGAAATKSPARSAALSGLGQCRRQEASGALIAALETGTASEKLTAIDALGVLGSSWAWSALGKDAEARGIVIRNAASDALLQSFQSDADLRSKAERAIHKIAAPNRVERIRGARDAAQGTTRAALESLLANAERRAQRGG